MTVFGAAPEATATLAQLAAVVDADRSARLYLDRGDGVLEIVAAVPDVGESPGDRMGTSRRLRRWLTRTVRPGGSATAHVVLPDERSGLLVLERWRAEPFSEDDLAIARVQARRLAGTVVTRLGRRPVAWSAQLEAVQSVAAQLTRLTSVEEVSAALCTQAQRVVAFDNARVYVLHEDGRTLEPVAFRPHAQEYMGEDPAGLRVTVGEGITGWVAATGQPINVPDAAADPRAIDIPGSLDIDEESMLLAPLRSEGRVIGVVVLSRLGLDRFSDDELRLLVVLADQAAVAVENARLLAERDRHVTELAALLDVSQAGGGGTDERELAGVLADKLRSAAEMDSSLIWRWEDPSGHLVGIGASERPLEGQGRDLAVHRAARHVLINDAPLWLDPSLDDVEPSELERLAALGGAAALLVPMSTAGRVVGLVELISRRSGRHFHAGEIAWLQTMANQAATALENASLVRQLRDAAETDLLTGVYNHRHLQDRIRHETARAGRTGAALSVLMIDLDDFKRINDEHGHQTGDRVLRAIASALRLAVRGSDVVARYGGDEFVVLMPDTDESEASRVVERARQAVAGSAHTMGDGSVVHVTCSVGLACHPIDGVTARDLLRRADAAMYDDKRSRTKARLAAGRRGRPPQAVAVGPESEVTA